MGLYSYAAMCFVRERFGWAGLLALALMVTMIGWGNWRKPSGSLSGSFGGN